MARAPVENYLHFNRSPRQNSRQTRGFLAAITVLLKFYVESKRSDPSMTGSPQFLQ
jgi:hypothetical protein